MLSKEVHVPHLAFMIGRFFSVGTKLRAGRRVPITIIIAL